MPSTTFTYIYETDVAAEAPAIWALYDDVTTWPTWDVGSERVTRDGAFAAGTTGTMKLVGQEEPLAYRLTEVQTGRRFVDETVLGPITVRVDHQLRPRPGGGTRIRQQVEIDGPAEQTAEIGAAVTSDMPDTVAALTALALQRR